ncbi:MAG: integrase domain-containing protein [Cellvibrionaceae bacterium]|nr:integrase domain-containing protein [Cellvibrionaceae bacterium]
MVNSQRNFGKGKRLSYAGVMALKKAARDRGGRHSWYAANKLRWGKFCTYAESQGIKDARNITPELVECYAKTLSGKAVSTQQNYLSAVNTVMTLVSGNRWEKFSPRNLVGVSRCSIRTKSVSVTYEQVVHVSKALREKGHIRLSFIPLLSFLLGLRRKEAALLDVHSVFNEAKKYGSIDVVRGTKGGRGRYVRRDVPAGEQAISVLEEICNFLPKEDRCLVSSGTEYQAFNAAISHTVLPVLKDIGIDRLHDLRAAYACHRYKAITSCDAPCNRKSSDPRAEKNIDLRAREIISLELGHNRTQVTNSYIGTDRAGGKQDD